MRNHPSLPGKYSINSSLAIAAVVLTLSACGGLNITSADLPKPDLSNITIAFVSGTAQQGTGGAGLPAPIIVRLTRAGTPWASTSLSVELTQRWTTPNPLSSKTTMSSATSDANGIATINPQFGAGAGIYTIRVYYATCSTYTYYIGTCSPENRAEVGSISTSGPIVAGG